MIMMNKPHNLIMPVLILLAMASMAAAQAGSGDWGSFILNNYDTRYQVNSTINAHNIRNLTQSWAVNLSAGTLSTPLVVNGSVYLADLSGNVYSLSLATGSPNWVRDIGLGNAIQSTPQAAGGVLYVAVGSNSPAQVYALSQASGNIIWQANLGVISPNLHSSPILYHGMVYIGVEGEANAGGSNAMPAGGIFALNASIGKIVWEFNAIQGTSSGAAVAGSVAVDPILNSIYFGTANAYAQANTMQPSYVYAIISLNATSGRPDWYHQVHINPGLGLNLGFVSTPNLFSVNINGVTHQALGIGSTDGAYYVLDRATGLPLENFSIASGSNYGISGASGLYYPSETGYFSNPEIFIPSDYNSNGSAVGNGTIAAVYSSGGFAPWTFITPGILTGSVALTQGTVFFGDDRGNLYALSIANGSVLFHAKLVGRISGGVTVAGNHMLVGTAFGPSNSLYSFSVPAASGASVNQTLNEMLSALSSYGFSDITKNPGIATISPPAVIFSAFDKNAYGKGVGADVLVFALPLGYEFENWNSSNPTKYEYMGPTGLHYTGTINFEPAASNDFTSGASSGTGMWLNWKELVPLKGPDGLTNQSLGLLYHLGLWVLLGIAITLAILAIIVRRTNKRRIKEGKSKT